MKCLLVTSHPLHTSLCKSLTEHVKSSLLEAGHTAVVEDLYATNFQPALTISERTSYYAGEYDASNITEEVRHLQEADALVLVFPTWWFGFPAILKGWFDRVWGPGIAYEHATDLGAIKALLDNLQEVIVVTTLGSPWWVDRFILRQPVKRIVKLALLGTCAKKSRLQFLSLYNSEKLDEKKVLAFKKKIDKALAHWK